MAEPGADPGFDQGARTPKGFDINFPKIHGGLVFCGGGELPEKQQTFTLDCV